jgi:FkbM family methyltransferase
MPQKVWQRCHDIVACLLEASAVKTVFDVGARDCGESADFARAYPAATVYAFECNPATLPKCRAVAAAEPRVRLTERAATDVDGPLSFFPIDLQRSEGGTPGGNHGASSMFEATGAYPEEKYVQNRIDVEGIRLDGFCAAHGIERIDVLWMDVQGAEQKVLDGLGAVVGRVSFIHMEVEFFEIYKGQALFPSVDAFLRGRGFTLAGFTSYSQYAADALYVGPGVAFPFARARAAFPFLARNLAKYRRHRLKRAIRRTLGLREWPQAREAAT